MSWAGLKITLDGYFGFNFIYAGIIALLIFGIIYLCKRQNILHVGMLAIYIALLIGGTMMNRGFGATIKMELIPFWSYHQYFVERNPALLGQMIFNVLLFIPWPILFSKVFPEMKKAIWAIGSAFLFSASIEVTQLIFKLGLFEFDDMFHNVLGAVIGYYILVLCAKRQKKGIEE